MEWLIKEWNTSTGAYIRTLGYLKSVHYKAQCNDTSDLRFGSLLNEILTVEVYNSNEAKLTAGAWVSFEAKNNPAADDASRAQGFTDTEYTFYGIYKVDQVTDGNGYYAFTAYSSTHDLNVDYSARLKYLGDSGSFPMTALALVQDACSYIGLTSFSIVGSNPLTSMQIDKFYANGITVADILSAAAEIYGGIVVDKFGSFNEPLGTYPLSSTTRGIVFKHISNRINSKTGGVQFGYYYLVAPTDSAVPHTAFDRPGSFEFFSNVYYKENGLTVGVRVNAVTQVIAETPSGSPFSYPQSASVPVDNIYKITRNVLIDNCANFDYSMLSELYYWISTYIGNWGEYNAAEVKLFPFNCPFRCGDIALVTNGSNIQIYLPVVQFEINDDEAVLESSGNEFYESAQNQYTTPEDVGTSNSVEIEKLRETKADLSMLANGSVKFVAGNLSANQSMSFTVSNLSRFVVFYSGASSNAMGMWFFYAASNGAVGYKTGIAASGITFSTGTNTFTLSSTTAGSYCVMVFNGTVL